MATAYTCRSPIVTWRHYYDFKHTLMNRRIAAAFHQNGSCSRCCKKQPGHVTTSHRFSLLARWFTSYRPSTVCQRRYMTPLTTLLVACMPQIVRLLIETHSTGRRHSAVFALGNFTPRHSEITGIIIVIILRRIRVHSCVVCMHKSTRYAPAGYTRTLVVSSSSVTFAQFPHINAAFNALHEYVRELTSVSLTSLKCLHRINAWTSEKLQFRCCLS